jgi:Acyl-CoA reductase (LuxC)
VSDAAFQGWALPTGIEVPSATETVELPTGALEFLRPPRQWWTRLAGGLREARTELCDRPARDIAVTLGTVGARFRTPGDRLREEALAWMPSTASLSDAMAERVLDGMARDWTGDRLTRLLELEFDPPEVLDGFISREVGGSIYASGAELSLHIGSGTVPGVTATSLVRSLLVKSPAIVKPGLGDLVLPVLWLRGLREVDAALADACAVTYWPGGETETEDELFDAVDAVVAYGRDSTLRSLRDRLPLSTRFIPHGHRAGIAAISRESLSAGSLEGVARAGAYAVGMFDQRGCVSPHVIYVELGGAASPDDFMDSLSREFAALDREVPTGEASLEEASALQQLRGREELRAAEPGSGVRVRVGPGGSWCVVLDPDPAFKPSCLRRFVWVKPIDDLALLPDILTPVSPHLQTLALEAASPRREAIVEALGRIGISRFTTLAEAPWPPAWWHHDGQGPLRALVSWVEDEGTSVRVP